MKIDFTIFKAYDVRGVYPEQINEEAVYNIGRAFVVFNKAKEIIVGRDMRVFSSSLFDSLTNGITEQGADVIDIGEISTDVLYFASGKLNKPGIMITASHLSGQYNGLKLCYKGAEPISQETGIIDIKKLVLQDDFNKSEKQGKIIKKDILDEYTKHILTFVDGKSIGPLKVVIDAGNGMAGKIVPLVFRNLQVKIIPLYFELDGSFPNHLANPIELVNLVDLQKKVLSEKADLGMAFDGDGDRIFFTDEKAKAIRSSLIIALLVKNILTKHPDEKIIYNVPCSRIVPEIIREYNGEPIIERVGHSFIKQKMKQTGAIFAGEHSGHYFFRDNFRADSGLIAGLIILEIVSQENKPFSQIIQKFEKYFSIKETNFEVEDKQGIMEKIEEKYKHGKISHLDGLTVEYSDWWFNVRPSNTESLLRLNLEADTEGLMKEKTEEISQLIKN
ncbi:MAG: phosphomannomutase/phosphoglucomutase [bacterium]